ncbi:MAG: hypothetical protein AB7O97_23675 [Planctomycetota bacterium]
MNAQQNLPPNGPSDHLPLASPGAGSERTKWSMGLISFYLSCAGVALGSTVGSAGFLWFDSVGALVFGIVMTTVCAVTCFLALRAARR